MEPENKNVDEMQEFVDSVQSIKSTETCTLPSKGLLYKPEENIPPAITIRRMTTKEDKMRMRNQSDNIIIRDILQSCILDQGVDAGKLKVADANYLLFKLRVISLLDDTYKIVVSDTRAYKLMGNAMGLNVVDAIVKELVEYIPS